jgi:hypothetical protein
MHSFSRLAAGVLAAASLLASAGAYACQPPPSPPPPPRPVPGESQEDYRTRTIAALRAHDEREAAELRASRLRWENRLWDDAPRIFAAEVIDGPRITKQKRTHRDMVVRLRPLAAARGLAPDRPFTLRYRMDWTTCGYDGGDHVSFAQTGDVIALFAAEGRLRYETLLGGINRAIAVRDDTITLLGGPRP